MSEIKEIAGGFDGGGRRVGIVAGRFNEALVDRLIAGATDTLLRHGVPANSVTLVRVPGCFELPLTAKRMAATGQYDAIVALGVVIRGATPHFEYVAGECAAGLARVALESDLPVAFGVLTTETIDQAVERAGSKAGNKGADAAMTALEMMGVLEQLGKRG